MTPKQGSTVNLKSAPKVGFLNDYSVDVIDWGSNAEPYGFSEMTSNFVHFQRIGKAVFMNVNLVGTSNDTRTYIKLPYPMSNEKFINICSKVQDNTVASSTPGRISLAATGTVYPDKTIAELYKDPINTAWTASGTKDWIGQFIYTVDDFKNSYDFYNPDASTDWASGGGVTGFSALTRNNFYYQKIGNVVLCRVYFNGTSNATTITATLPFPCRVMINNPSGMVTNNGTRLATTGLVEITAGSSTVNFYRDNIKTAFTASGSKIWAGWFFYFTD